MGRRVSRVAVAVAGVCLLLQGCQIGPPAQPSIPAEAIFLARNNPGVAAGDRVVAISARNGTDAAELGSTGGLRVALNGRGEIAEGYMVGRPYTEENPGVTRFQLGSKVTTQAITNDPVDGDALVDAPNIGMVLVVKDSSRCAISAYHAGVELWTRSVQQECQLKQEQVGQRGNLVITLEHSTFPTGLVDPVTGDWTPLVYPAANCELIGDIGRKPLFACWALNGSSAEPIYTLRFEGGAPLTDSRFGRNLPIVLKVANRPESVVWTEGLFFVLDAHGRVLKSGVPPSVAPPGSAVRPVLSPDLSSLYYSTADGVKVQSISTGATRMLTRLAPASLAFSHDGPFLYALTRTDLEVIYMPTAQRVARYPQDARAILLVATAPVLPPGLPWKPPLPDVDVPSPVVSPTPPTPSPLYLAAGCRLPVASYGQATGSVEGFLNVCTGTFTEDPASKMTFDTETDREVTVATPHLYGNGGIAYVPEVRRWIPVVANQISPDGRRYVYLNLVWRPDRTSYDPRGVPDHWEMRVVDIASATDRVVGTASMADAFRIVRFTDAGIYLTQICPSGCPEEYGRLWMMDPTTGKITKLSDIRGQGWQIEGGYVWTIADQTQAPSAASGPRVSPPSQTLFRLDLQTGRADQWLQTACCGVGLAEVDSTGAPLLIMTGKDGYGPVQLVRLTVPNRPQFVADVGSSTFVTHAEGTWFYYGGYVYLYVPPGRPKAIAATGGYIYTVVGELGP